jgi:hypothetical protein
MTVETIIENGTVLAECGLCDAGLAIDAGGVAAVAEDGFVGDPGYGEFVKREIPDCS